MARLPEVKRVVLRRLVLQVEVAFVQQGTPPGAFGPGDQPRDVDDDPLGLVTLQAPLQVTTRRTGLATGGSGDR